MRKIYFSIILLTILASCSFLEESSQNLMKPESVKDYKELLYGEILQNNKAINTYLEFMTDDVQSYNYYGTSPWQISNDFREGMWSYFTWQSNPESGFNNTFIPDDAWETYYHKILMCNVFLGDLQKMKGTDKEKEDLAGEVYFMRAYSYFMLANLYAAPYSKATDNTDLCVVINEENSISDKMYKRATVRAVYDKMENDIAASISHFKNSGISKSIYRPNIEAAYILASRIFLFEEKYDEVIKYCNLLLKTTSHNLIELTEKSENFFLSPSNPEIVFSFGLTKLESYFPDRFQYAGAFAVSKELIDSYITDDFRLNNFYNHIKGKQDAPVEKDYELYTPQKWSKYKYTAYSNAFRIAEAYINRAEAYAAKGENAKALKDLNAIWKKRVKSGTASLSGADVKKLVREERRREFAFEGMRWFDIRRYGIIGITHKYTSKTDENAGEKYTLKDKASYILPIPKSEKDRNTEIEIFARPESKPEN